MGMNVHRVLHGRAVIVTSADTERRCTIRSGCGGEHPFHAIDRRGRVQHVFSPAIAKQLRESGTTSHMMLI